MSFRLLIKLFSTVELYCVICRGHKMQDGKLLVIMDDKFGRKWEGMTVTRYFFWRKTTNTRI
jgi:hypothetical protein